MAESKRPFWFRGAGHVLTLAASLMLVSGILLSSLRADHAAEGDMARVSAEMSSIAQDLLDSVAGGPGGIESAVGYDRGALLHLDFEDEARGNYVYWPYLRKGLPLEFMDLRQRMLTHDLLHSALSAKGYLDAVQIMQLERILMGEETVGFPRGSENYTLALFGDPGGGEPWGWRFEGHHLSLNFTVAPGLVSVTPSFFGASPAQQRSGPLAGFRVLREIHELGLSLVNALDQGERERAVAAGRPPFDIVSGTLNRPGEEWDDWKSLPDSGLPVAEMNAGAIALAAAIVERVTGAYREDIAAGYRRQVDPASLRFTWYGGTSDGEAHYWRLDGPDFFYEYDLVQNEGNHVHTVWRSKEGDFGADLLLRHRRESH